MLAGKIRRGGWGWGWGWKGVEECRRFGDAPKRRGMGIVGYGVPRYERLDLVGKWKRKIVA